MKLTSLDISNFDTSNVLYMDYMFYYMLELNSIDVSNFNTQKLVKADNMFGYLKKIKILDLVILMLVIYLIMFI